MKCAAEPALRAFVDHEMARSESERIAEHVKTCNRCAQEVRRIENDSQTVRAWMNALPEAQHDEEIDPKLAYARYEAAVANRTPKRSTQIPVWLRMPQISAGGAVAVLVLLFSFTPVRIWGQHFLQMLRVQKVAVIPVNTTLVTHGRDHGLSQLISDSVVVTLRPGNPVVVPDAASAGAKAGFTVETLDSLGAPQQIDVQDEGAFHMTLDVDKIRAVLEEAGRSDIQVPDSINGGTIAVHVPKGVKMQYGNCGGANSGANRAGWLARPASQPQGQREVPMSSPAKKDSADSTCTVFLQIPSPILSVPPGLNMPALAEAALQLAGVSAADANNFAQTVDWSSTLVIPVPQDQASYRTVPVDGVNGTLIETMPGRGPRAGSTLIWVKNGVVRSVASHGGSDQILAAVANLGS